MSIRYHPLPSPKEVLSAYPASECNQAFIQASRKEIASLLNLGSAKQLLIVGPCSIHNATETLEYATLLKRLQSKISSFLLVMRVHFEKPRSSLGWKGFVYDPHLDGTYDMHTGLNETRKLLLSLCQMNVPVAAEILDPSLANYFKDLLSWGCVGARTASSQIHRQIASSLPFPIGFKNTTEGSVEAAVSGALSASMPHSYFGMDQGGRISQIHSLGNPDVHVILRGGRLGPNYDPESIGKAVALMKRAHLKAKILIDCSHDNSKKDPLNQVKVFQSIIHQSLENNLNIRGAILESNIKAGNQPFPEKGQKPLSYVSLTDACLSWEMTEELIVWADAKKSLTPFQVPCTSSLSFS